MVSFFGDQKIEMKKPCIFPFIMQKLVSLIKNRIWKENARRLSKNNDCTFYCLLLKMTKEGCCLFFKEQHLCVIGDNNFYLGEKKKYLGHRFIQTFLYFVGWGIIITIVMVDNMASKE